MEKLNCTKDDLGTVACTMKAFKKQYCYPGFSGADLVEEMMCYGISGIALDTCGSTKQGVRACTSLIQREQIPVLAERLAAFAKDHPVK